MTTSVRGLTCEWNLVNRPGRAQILILNPSISGVDWVAQNVKLTGRPSVVSMSIQGGPYDPANMAVQNVVHFLICQAFC